MGRELTVSTGRKYLTVLSGVLAYAADLGLSVDPSAIPTFREQLRRRSRTKQVETTLAIYSHVSAEEHAKAAELLDSLLGA